MVLGDFPHFQYLVGDHSMTILKHKTGIIEQAKNIMCAYPLQA
jgi:hypothetical protein